MNSRIFFWNIVARVALLMATIFLFIWFADILRVEFLFTLLVGTFLIILQVFLLTRYVLGITRVIEQFIDAIGKEETPEIQFGTGKALFRRLKEQSNSIKQAMNARRLEKEKDDRILIHVINSADPGLFCFNSRGEVLFLNETARDLVQNVLPPYSVEQMKTGIREFMVEAARVGITTVHDPFLAPSMRARHSPSRPLNTATSSPALRRSTLAK